MRGTNGENLGADLNEAGEEYVAVTDRSHLADEADVRTGSDGELGKMEQAGVAEVDVDVAGWCLQKDMRADWRSLGIFGVTEDRSLDGDIFGNIVSGLRRSCSRLLREGGDGRAANGTQQ